MNWNTVIQELYDEVMKQVEENEKKMEFEYKFYEKNQCPKWIEGDYDLHIEGNKMTMTSKDGIKVSARCHPDDDWRLQIGLDELKDRMDEKKKLPLKSGDIVTITSFLHYCAGDCTNFFDTEGIESTLVLKVHNNEAYSPSCKHTYIVICVGNMQFSSNNCEVALIADVDDRSRLFVMDTKYLHRIEN